MNCRHRRIHSKILSQNTSLQFFFFSERKRKGGKERQATPGGTSLQFQYSRGQGRRIGVQEQMGYRMNLYFTETFSQKCNQLAAH